jgi:hypothetical protein
MALKPAARVLALLLVAVIAVACSRGSETRTGSTGLAPGTEASPPSSAATQSAGAEEVAETPSPNPSASPGDAERARFAGRISPIPPSLAGEMRGTTWRPGCPVPLSELRLLRFNYVGFDGEIKRGPMVVNASVAEDVLSVFERLFETEFPIKRVGLAREFKESRLEEDPHTRRSVTASFNCRVVVTPAGAGTTFSQHSYGLAVDINPVQNPYVSSDGWVRNKFARPYVDRSGDLVGMIHDGDLVVRSFAAIGWEWGGHWSTGKDYMHFSLLGR